MFFHFNKSIILFQITHWTISLFRKKIICKLSKSLAKYTSMQNDFLKISKTGNLSFLHIRLKIIRSAIFVNPLPSGGIGESL